jgi:hypothetical protein
LVLTFPAWLDLMPYLEKKRDEAMAEQDEEILDDD